MLPFQLETRTNSGTTTTTYFLPESWEEMNYEQYLDYLSVTEDDSLSVFEKAGKILSILAGIPQETILAAGFDLVNRLFAQLGFIQTPIEAKPVAFVTVGGVNYYPQLLETFGELLFYDRIATQYEDNPREQWPYILGVLLRPRVEITLKQTQTPWYQRIFGRKPALATQEITVEPFTNDPELILKRGKLFALTLNPVQVLGLAAFFLRKDEALQSYFQNYSSLPRWITKRIENLASISVQSMAGNPRWTSWNRMYFATVRFLIRASLKY